MQGSSFNIEDHFGEFAKAGALAEAAAYPTVPTGPYRVQVTKYDGKKFDNDPRPYAHLTVSIQDETGTKKLSTAFVDVTWIEGRTEEGKLDRGIKFWEQITRALYPDLNAVERAAKDVGTVLNDVKQYPLSAYVMEKFKVGEKWVTTKVVEEAKGYRESGARVINTISNFQALR